MPTTYTQSEQPSQIHLAIDVAKLEDLIRSGTLHASDFSCLDSNSKKGVWSMLRSVAASKLNLGV